MIAIVLTDVAGVAAEMERDQPIVDRDIIQLAENARLVGPDRDAALGRATIAKIFIEPSGNDHEDGAGAARPVDIDLAGTRSELIQSRPGRQNIGRERVDIPQ